MSNYRAYDRVGECILYSVKKYSEHCFLGRKQGTEEWVLRLGSDLVLQRATRQHDITLRPIFEDDVLRSQDGSRYRVEYQAQGDKWMLYDMDRRMYLPFQGVHLLQIVSHKYDLMTEFKANLSKPFPEPILEPVKEETPQNQVFLSIESRPISKPLPLSNQMASPNQKLTRAEAVEIPSFMHQRKRVEKGYA